MTISISLRKSHRATGSDVAMLPRGGTIKCFAAILNADKSLEANLENKHGGPCRGRLFWRKIVPYTWNNEQHRQTRRKEEFLNSRKTLQEII